MTIGYDPAQPLWERQLQDVTRFSLPTLLRYEDRNSMGNSVESRLPFLDYRLVELALALPTALKIRRGYGKWIVRRATHGMVHDRIRLARYKRPFDVHLRRWIEQGLGESIRSRLRGTAAKTRGFLAPDTGIDDAWSDDQLVKRSSALAEAVTLIWLGDRMQ
jgi:asparagine synthase (glutamine-hydrolysing)